MKIIYTRHAKRRMRWRVISKEEVELKTPTVRKTPDIITSTISVA